MDKEKLIKDYFANKLSENDKADVEQLLEKDLDFKTEFESFKDIAMAFKISEASDLKKKFQKFETELSPNKNRLSRYKYIYLAIASVIIIGFFYNSFNNQSGNDLFNSNFEIYPNTYQPITRSSQGNTSAFVAYENGDFLSAEKEFELLLKVSENANIRFYYASSLLNQSKFDLALEEFEALTDKEFDYTSEVLWYSALINLRKENYLKADDYLTQLSELGTDFKTEETKLLIENLNKR